MSTLHNDWVYEPVISKYQADLFYRAMIHHCDNFHYYPIAIARREQTGMKYRFLCIAKLLDNSKNISYLADIEIYKPILGPPYITALYKQDINMIFTQKWPTI